MPSAEDLKGFRTPSGTKRIKELAPEPESGLEAYQANPHMRGDLNYKEQAFVDEYIKDGDATKASIRAGLSSPENRNAAHSMGTYMLTKPNIKAAIMEAQEYIHNDNVADAQEIYEFFTKAMRGELLDQFGLDPTLKDRMEAAKVLIKLQIEMPARVQHAQDNELTIKLIRE